MEQKNILIRNAVLVNEGRQFNGFVLIRGQIIKAMGEGEMEPEEDWEVIDAEGLLLLPGIIDCHVHFREPEIGRAHV